VPDELTNQIVIDRIQQPDCVPGFVLDGYPRNSAQQKFLDELVNIDVAIVISLSDADAITRLSGRLACKCGLSYHTEFNPPKQAGVCDKCGSELFRRDDDQPEAIKQRLAIYHDQTEPVFEVYRAAGKLHEVDGSQSIEGVYNTITTILDTHV
jgi:adenylate kinase